VRKYWALLGFLVTTVAFAETYLVDWIVAVVNEEAITYSELQKEINTLEVELKQRKTQLPPRKEFEKQVLEHLILNRIQLQLADKTGIKVDDSTLNSAVAKIAEQNGMKLETLQQTLEQDGLNFEDFRKRVREEVMIQRLQQRQISNAVTVTDREVDSFLSSQAKQSNAENEYHLQHILIAVPEGASPEVISNKKAKAEKILKSLQEGADFKQTAISNSDGRQAFEGGELGWKKMGEIPSLFSDVVPSMQSGEIKGLLKNSSGFHIVKLVEMRGGQQLVVAQTKARHILIKTNEVVSDSEAESRLLQLKERIESGQSFEELAAARSEDSASAKDGGDLGWLSPGQAVPEFEEAIQNLPIGKLSQPFKTRYGWHLVKVEERRNYDNTQEAERSQATRQIRQRKIEEELQNWLRQLRDESYVENRIEKQI
jgi:peptidyl-prolyl cis-trans isomerase SurA